MEAEKAKQLSWETHESVDGDVDSDGATDIASTSTQPRTPVPGVPDDDGMARAGDPTCPKNPRENLARRSTEEYVSTSRTGAQSESTQAPSPGLESDVAPHENTRKISDILLQSKATGRATVSFEFFPPSRDKDLQTLVQQIERVGLELRPSFISLTWSASCKHWRQWMDLGDLVQKQFGIPVLMHLTCHLPKDRIAEILDQLRSRGLRNILALRGDLPAAARGTDELGHSTEAWQQNKAKGCFTYAIELVKFIRQKHGNYFCVAVGGYPEVHLGCWNNAYLPPSERAKALDLQYLKEKVDAGADFIISQFVYDPELFLSWRQSCRDVGITEPIVAGYLPLQKYSVFERFITWCRATVPIKMQKDLAIINRDEKAVQTYGVKMAVAHLRTLLLGTADLVAERQTRSIMFTAAPPCHHIHLYTANRVGPYMAKVLQKLDLLPYYSGQRRYGAGFQWDSCYQTCHNNSQTDCDKSQEANASRPNSASGNRYFSRGGGDSGRTSRGTASSVSSGNGSQTDLAGAAAGGLSGGTQHEVRPIFWENRQSSYLQRTKSWEEFPNGRWGSQGESFGTLTEYVCQPCCRFRVAIT